MNKKLQCELIVLRFPLGWICKPSCQTVDYFDKQAQDQGGNTCFEILE